MATYEEGHRDGYIAGFLACEDQLGGRKRASLLPGRRKHGKRKKRKLSAWNKFVKANSKKPRFIYRTGKLNLKKMAVAFRKTPAGKKKRKR
jgi:hypothetical protein